LKKRKINDFLKRLRKAKTAAAQFEKPEVVKTHMRGLVILPEMSHSVIAGHPSRFSLWYGAAEACHAQVVGVYNGKTFNSVEIKVTRPSPAYCLVGGRSPAARCHLTAMCLAPLLRVPAEWIQLLRFLYSIFFEGGGGHRLQFSSDNRHQTRSMVSTASSGEMWPDAVLSKRPDRACVSGSCLVSAPSLALHFCSRR
jgi:ribosomal protein S19